MGMLFIWAIKMEATVTNSAVPSMFTVAPIGSTNLEILKDDMNEKVHKKRS